MEKDKLINEFVNAVSYMKKTKFNGTYRWILGRDANKNDWAIVLGWAYGFDETENDDCTDGAYRMCVKLAYQPWNSVMQCDYDLDWTMPYDEETGEVDDTEFAIYPNTNFEEAIDWLLERYTNYVH